MKFNIKKSFLIMLVTAVCLILALGFTGCKTSTPVSDTEAAVSTADVAPEETVADTTDAPVKEPEVVAESQQKEKMFYGLHHIGIYVVDRDESVAFYRDHLGFALDFTEEVEAGNGFLKIAVMRQNGINVELLQLVDSSQVKQQAEQTWNHFALYVKDIDKAIADLKATGEAKFEGEDNPVLNVPEFGKEDVQAAFFRVINGERIEIIEAVDNS